MSERPLPEEPAVPDATDPTPTPADPVAPSSATAGRADIWFLLDRSGSMASIARDVVGGFNTFFADQASRPGDALVSIVQFDTNDLHEVLVDRRPVATVAPLDPASYRPRGGTPLLDALGDLLDRAEGAGGPDGDQLVVIFTDGQENASHRWTRDDLFGRIARLSARGWTFAFLGANQDSYAEAGGLGLAAGSTSDFEASAEGVHRAFLATSRAAAEWRAKPTTPRLADRDEFWGGRKEAEER